MTDPVAGPMKIDAEGKSEDLPEEWGEKDDGESVPPAEQDWIDANEGPREDDESN